MRKSKAETALTRKRIVQVAAQAFRSNGIQATSVAEIMSAAGLTHGGFYRHFTSKEHLVAEACAAGMQSTLLAIGAPEAAGGQAVVDSIGSCLWDTKRDDCLVECPLIGMGSELARADPGTRRAATRGYLELIGSMAARDMSSQGAAIFAFSAIVGAVTISRIVDDPQLARRILDETKRHLAGSRPPRAARREAAAAVPEARAGADEDAAR
ncbi:TetR/AcrR family transcriptional regulator [Burkholderia plantarii]|uniref:TetR/AcrR family transcriptional regulator n=1 Tax=Burkholderia plantarii TaxID=41899 RepID=UPI000870B4D6|nr:TetR/AcrR family transcriptional regulator [Burkholderia plantarii]